MIGPCNLMEIQGCLQVSQSDIFHILWDKVERIHYPHLPVCYLHCIHSHLNPIPRFCSLPLHRPAGKDSKEVGRITTEGLCCESHREHTGANFTANLPPPLPCTKRQLKIRTPSQSYKYRVNK